MGENASSYDRTLAPVRGAALLRLLHLTQKNAFQASCRPETHQSWCVHILFGRLCYRKWLMLFSLKLQRDNRKNASAVDPAKGKTGKKAVFSSHCGDETTINYNRAFRKIRGKGAPNGFSTHVRTGPSIGKRRGLTSSPVPENDPYQGCIPRPWHTAR